MNIIFLGKTESTPLGIIYIAVSARGLIALSIGDEEQCLRQAKKVADAMPAYDAVQTKPYTDQLFVYLAKQSATLDLPIDWSVMSSFQRRVLQEVIKIPRGYTASYKDIAMAIGKPQAARAVGRAHATNPMPLIIPCHRVVSVTGALIGYSAAGGVKTKQWLLDFEKSYL